MQSLWSDAWGEPTTTMATRHRQNNYDFSTARAWIPTSWNVSQIHRIHPMQLLRGVGWKQLVFLSFFCFLAEKVKNLAIWICRLTSSQFTTKSHQAVVPNSVTFAASWRRGLNFNEISLIKVVANQLLPTNYGRWVTRRSPKRYLEDRPDGSAVGSICERRWCDSVSLLLLPLKHPSVRYNGVHTKPNTRLLHPYSMVTASRNNSQLESRFMNKWSIPRRPHFPRFGPFSWAHCWPWKEVI